MVKIFLTFVILVFSSVITADDENNFQEKCYCVAKAGENDGGPEGAHKSTKDYDCNDWVYVPKGSCVEIGGSLLAGQSPTK